MSKIVVQILAAPEPNLFLFAFLLNFVYEVWQAPYYEFYGSSSLADKVRDLTHCSFGDGVIILVCSWVVSVLVRWSKTCLRQSRNWVLRPTPKLTFLFTSIGLLITLVIETYRVNISKVYGVPVLAVPMLGMSSLAVIQWIVLPPLILYLARRQMLGYPEQQKFK